jgi:hypothetical protein
MVLPENGDSVRFAEHPIATPPARVAFCISTGLNRLLCERNEDIQKVTTVLPERARMVFTMALYK